MLIRCSECGGNVSDKAPNCPHCGAPVVVQRNTPPMPEIPAAGHPVHQNFAPSELPPIPPGCPLRAAAPEKEPEKRQEAPPARKPSAPEAEPERPAKRRVRRLPVTEDEDIPVPVRNEFASDRYVPPQGFDFAAFFLHFMKLCFFLLTLCIIGGSLCFFALRYDLAGLTTKLRTFAESDSGNGSFIDKSNSRTMFKYHLVVFLNAVQGRDTPEGGAKKDPADPVKHPQESAIPEIPVKPKEKREPLEFPPAPPAEP